MKRTITTVGLSAAAIMLSAAAANASVTVNSDGTGFVGKGDVQTALGWNNAQLQKNAASVGTIVLSQPVSQALTSTATQTSAQAGTQSATQSATQAGTETVTQPVLETKSCTITTGNEQHTNVDHRSGTRTGTVSGTRTGTRSGNRDATRSAVRNGVRHGTRAGSQTGTANATVAYDARTNSNGKDGSITGFNLTGYVGSVVTTLNGTPLWNDPSWEDWSYGDPVPVSEFSFGDYSWGPYDFTGSVLESSTTTWGEWTSESGDNPNVCDQSDNSGNVSDYSDTIVDQGDPTVGPIVDGLITPDAVVTGDFVAVGDPVLSDVTFDETQAGAVTPAGPYAVVDITRR